MLKILINQSQGIYDKAHHELVPNFGYSTRQIIGQFIFKEENLRQNHEAIKQNNEYFEVMIDTCHIKKDLRQINFCQFGRTFLCLFIKIGIQKPNSQDVYGIKTTSKVTYLNQVD